MVDAHCHIHLNNDNIFNTLDRAFEFGVNRILNIHEVSNKKDMEAINEIKEINQDFLKIFFGIGVHPNNVKDININEAEQLIETHVKNIICFGETGLDLFKDTNESQQLEFFEMHCNLSKKYNKPVVIHQRNCDINKILKIIEEFNIKAMFHCWTLGPNAIEKALNLGCMISFSGIITFDKTGLIPQACANCPIEQMFIETDAPYLAPTPYRGKKNEPAYIIENYKFISKLKDIDIEDLILTLRSNFSKFFNV